LYWFLVKYLDISTPTVPQPYPPPTLHVMPTALAPIANASAASIPIYTHPLPSPGTWKHPALPAVDAATYTTACEKLVRAAVGSRHGEAEGDSCRVTVSAYHPSTAPDISVDVST